MRRVVALVVLVGALLVVPAAGAKVLLVGTYHGVRGKYSSLQAAVNAARPGDWILLGPGDYKTTSSRHPQGRADEAAGVLVTKPDIWIVGMNRNSVIVDGTKSGPACSRSAADQNLGPKVKGKPQGLNGIMVFKANNVDIENLTVCNFLGGAGDAGNEVWWNGANGSGQIGGHGMWGSYLSATSTFYNSEHTAAPRAIRDLLEQRQRRRVDSHLHEQLQRLGLLHRRLRGSVQPDDQRRVGAVQRARVLGH